MKALKLQNYEDQIEVVLVDNLSTDYSVKRARSLFENTKIVELKEYKPGLSLNKGIEKASGDFIVCISAHCIPADENWLTNLIKPLKNEEIAAVYGRQIPTPNSNPKDKRDLWLTFGKDDRMQIKDPFLHNGNSAYRRKDLIKNPFSEEMTNIEDRGWASKELGKGRKIFYTASAKVYHDHGIHQTG